MYIILITKLTNSSVSSHVTSNPLPPCLYPSRPTHTCTCDRFRPHPLTVTRVAKMADLKVIFIFSLGYVYIDIETRTIIDKLANFVARNGPEFEAMTKKKQQHNSKFSFLFGGQYHQYYLWKVSVEKSTVCV